MAEYIEKELVLSKSQQDYLEGRYDYDDFVLVSDIESIPPADVRPVKSGRWEMDSDGIPHCTECGYVAPQRLFLQLQSLACTTRFIMSNYCPDCGSYNGADMRGGDADGDTKD